MSNRELPMMPWYPDQFRASTLGWTFMQRAIYQSLLDLQWMAGESHCISAKRSELARALEIDPRTLGQAWRVVGPKFAVVDGGLQNFRLEQHRLAALELRKKKSAAGVVGANSRWHPHTTVNADAMRLLIAQQCPPSLKNKKRTLPLALTSERKRAANGQGAAARTNAAGGIREDDPEIRRKRQEAETLAAQHAKPRDDDDGMPF